jgi:hypothetical protein
LPYLVLIVKVTVTRIKDQKKYMRKQKLRNRHGQRIVVLKKYFNQCLLNKLNSNRTRVNKNPLNCSCVERSRPRISNRKKYMKKQKVSQLIWKRLKSTVLTNYNSYFLTNIELKKHQNHSLLNRHNPKRRRVNKNPLNSSSVEQVTPFWSLKVKSIKF